MRTRRLMMLALSALGALALGAGSAQAGTGYGFSFSFGPPGGFSGPMGVAIDQSTGDVYVTDQGNNRLDKFSASGEIQKAFGVEGHVELSGAAPNQLTVDNYLGLDEGDVFVAGLANGVIYEIDEAGTQVTEVASGLASPSGVAVDAAGDFFVSLESTGTVAEFNSDWEPINAAGTVVGANQNTVASGLADPQTVAVSSTGEDLYVPTVSGTIRYTLSSGIYVRSAEPFDPAPSEGVTVAPSGNVFVKELLYYRNAEVAEYEPSGTLVATFGDGERLHEEGSFGVAVDGSDLYVADRNENAVLAFAAGPMPEAPVTGPELEAATKLTHTTAVLHGVLNPLTSTKIHWQFIYNKNGTCTGGETFEDEKEVGKELPKKGKFSEQAEVEGTNVKESAEVTGLASGETYTYCLVAVDSDGSVYGSPLSFTTLGSPDITGESFSAVSAKGATATGQVNPSGMATTYYVEYGTTSTYGSRTAEAGIDASHSTSTVASRMEGLQPGTEYHFRIVATNKAGTEYGPDTVLSTLPPVFQGLPDGRVYEMVTPPENQARELEIPQAPYYLVNTRFGGYQTEETFESSLSGEAIVYSAEPTSPGAGGKGGDGEGVPYLATRQPGGGWSQVNLSQSGVMQYLPPKEYYVARAPDLYYSAPDIYYRSPFSLTYEPLFSVIAPYSFGLPAVLKIVGASADHSLVFFEANEAFPGTGAAVGEPNENNLYQSVDGQLSLVNVLPDGKTEANASFGGHQEVYSHAISEDGSRVFWTDMNTGEVYVRENGLSTVPVSEGSAQFWTATPDGRYAFYTEGERLWRFDVESGARTELAGTGAQVQGVIGTSDNGETVYFAAGAALAPGATPQACESGNNGSGCNLYVRQGATTTFIAVLAGNNLVGSANNDWDAALSGRTAEVTPDGDALVFMSSESLTGYDNLGAGYNEVPTRMDEVYVYEAQGAEGGHLFCVSCSRSGEPIQNNIMTHNGGIAAFLPISWSPTYLPHWLSDDGSRVFFDSEQPLVAQDTDGTQDVYEWERDGTGSCQESAGCVYLLSAGTSEAASWFIAASGTGDDVFIATRSPLVREDGNESYNLFDARVGGVQPPLPAECSGTGCQGLPSPPPVFATPSSATFNGVGNFPVPTPASVPVKPAAKPKAKRLTRAQKLADALRSCAKHSQKRKRASCQARARKSYAAKSSTGKASKGRN